MIAATVSEEQQGERLDIFVQSLVPQLSRSFVHKLSEQKRVRVNDGTEKAGYKLKTGDTVTVDYDPAELERIPDIDLPVIYEDDDCLVIDKPVGVLTHSKGGFNPEGTVATFVRRYIKHMEGERAGIVHRLDRATSGVIICAKHPIALAWLQKQFSQRKVKKTYFAIVRGQLQPDEAVIDMPIERNPAHPQTFHTSANGKPALTTYRVVERTENYDQVLLEPETGRTHQLRVHLRQVGHPIVGDMVYDGEPADRLYLHAYSLEITLPKRERKTFISPLPTEFADFMEHSHE
jgi:23S rRNA pseudouridine1911/1915/1917 synthase